ncbi:hypothetical protein [Pseudomonas sp.]|uniref:hypothetical protein n=1 Tax=Pseudomonas sp. TaxID=306 RepID=UPI002609DAB0|nr:hypothetical protein [Pseudomonas sp.]
MSPSLTIFMLITGWLSVAAAMLWGLMRISRHHAPPAQAKSEPAPVAAPEKPATHTANAH